MSFIDISDNELIYLTRSSNEDAKDYLISRYKRRIYGMISSLVGKLGLSNSDYEDYYQESFIVFLKCLDLYDMDFNFYNYLFSALERELKRKKKIQQKHDNTMSLEYCTNDGLALIDVISEEDSSYQNVLLDNYISLNFSEIEQDIIRLKIKGYDCLEISKIIGLSQKNVYRKLKDIRKIMLNSEI